jgi:negative regulator of flagellin synthesis FlgM
LDRVEISAEALEAARLAEAAAGGASAGPDVRTDLVNRLRAEIASGTYETPERLDGALDRLLNQLG